MSSHKDEISEFLAVLHGHDYWESFLSVLKKVVLTYKKYSHVKQRLKVHDISCSDTSQM